MYPDAAILKINDILVLLDKNKKAKPAHLESYLFLEEKYKTFKERLIEKKDFQEFIEWNKWFAPRIIFDGINEKEILVEVENLNELLHGK